MANYKSIPDYERILYLNYEEMLSNIDDVIMKTAQFLNKEVSSKNLELRNEHIKFDYMKRNVLFRVFVVFLRNIIFII